MEQSKKKKILSVILFIVAGITVFLCISGVIVFLLARSIYNKTHRPEYHVGDTITLGKYEQDGFINKKEDIEWIVVSVEEDRILVVSQYALDAIPYNLGSEDVTWETSYIRKWLNENIYKRAFTIKEKNRILPVTLHNPENPYDQAEGGNDTVDYVFCLSLEEAEKYFGDYNFYDEDEGYGFKQKLMCMPTQHAINNGASSEIIFADNFSSVYMPINYTPDAVGVNFASWWLRDPAIDYDYDGACMVDCDGRVGPNVKIMTIYESNSVRPAMYLKY